MRKASSFVVLSFITLSIAVVVLPAAVAEAQGQGQEPQGIQGVEEGAKEADSVLFHWLHQETLDWGRGGMFAALGAVGALVTMFALIGGAVPGTAGQAGIDADRKRLALLYKQLLTQAQSATLDTEAVRALNEVVDTLRDDLRRERWRQFRVASLFYVVLGAFFASALAYDLLQAIVIGAGWTGYAGVLGLKKDFQQRKQAKDEQLSAAEEVITTLQRDGHAAVGSEEAPSLESRRLAHLQEEIRVAKAL